MPFPSLEESISSRAADSLIAFGSSLAADAPPVSRPHPMRLRPELRQYLISSVPALFAIPLGFVAFFGPTITRRLASGQPVTVESLGAAQESCGVTQLLLLALVGCVTASFTDSPAFMIGFLTIVGLPIWSLIDAANAYKHGVESHNLLGIEWVFYAAYGAFPAAGAFLIRRARGRRGGRTQ